MIKRRVAEGGLDEINRELAMETGPPGNATASKKLAGAKNSPLGGGQQQQQPTWGKPAGYDALRQLESLFGLPCPWRRGRR